MGRGGRLLLRRAARARTVHDAAQGAIDRRPAPAVRGLGLPPGGAAAAAAASWSACKWFNENRPDLLRQPQPARAAGRRRALHALAARPTTSCAGCWRACSIPTEFLGDHGIRSLSRYHLDHPYVFNSDGQEYRGRLPAGRVRHRDVRRQLELARPDLGADQRAARPGAAADVRVLRRRVPGRVPDRLGPVHDPVSRWRRSCRTGWRASSCATTQGRRPVYGGTKKFVDDPHWNDHVLFYEYFHGDNGAGLGASHQTGWTAVIPAHDAAVRAAHARR